MHGAPAVASTWAGGCCRAARAGEPLESLEQTVVPAGLRDALDRLQIDLALSQGLQYYTGMVFEIDHGDLG